MSADPKLYPPDRARCLGADAARPVLSVCLRCRDGQDEAAGARGGTRLAEAIAQAASGRPLLFGLRGIRCMSQCRRPCTVALSGAGRFTYLFGDLSPAHHAGAVLDLAHRYARAPEGFLPRDERPAPLRASILGRVPPLGSASDIVEPWLHAACAPSSPAGGTSA